MSKTIQINEVDVSDTDIEYTCFGLGSCIGLFVADRSLGIAGAAHIPLPDGEGPGGELQDANRLIRLLLKGFQLKGSNLQTLRAKIAGGSSIYNVDDLQKSLGVGEQNVQAVIKLLVENKIYLAATDVGGTVSRTARYDSRTGQLFIRTSEKKSYII